MSRTRQLVPIRPRSERTVERDFDLPGNRYGRASSGLYPNVSRTKLAKATGKHITTVTGYLLGRMNPPLSVAALMARLLGITMEQLSADLKQKQVEYARLKVELAERENRA